MHKDQLYGGIIFVVAIVLIIFYNLWLFGFLKPSLDPIYTLYIPVWLLVMLVLGIAGWIGWTMASTPPPKPIEELTAPVTSDTTPTSATKTDDKPSESKKT